MAIAEVSITGSGTGSGSGDVDILVLDDGTEAFDIVFNDVGEVLVKV
jgi:hypothetical protein